MSIRVALAAHCLSLSQILNSTICLTMFNIIVLTGGVFVLTYDEDGRTISLS